MTDDLTAHNRDDGKVVIRGDNPNAWILFDPETAIMTDEELESQSPDWTPGRPDSYPSSGSTDVDDWEVK